VDTDQCIGFGDGLGATADFDAPCRQGSVLARSSMTIAARALLATSRNILSDL
jgi:hypothetical protein